ncbi:MAG: hypothetical protein OXQ90_20460 [Gammaproteobacteria bacterium]|nr:hypothetical protein [Gammaproteobacteria bacterium]
MALFKRKTAKRDDVRAELEWILDNAWGLGLTDATLTSASLRERVLTDHGEPDDLKPTCISVMRDAMRHGDERLVGERGSDFAVRYRLEPRRTAQKNS